MHREKTAKDIPAGRFPRALPERSIDILLNAYRLGLLVEAFLVSQPPTGDELQKPLVKRPHSGFQQVGERNQRHADALWAEFGCT